MEGYDPEGDVLTPPLQAFLQACKGTDDLSACGFMQFIEREDLIGKLCFKNLNGDNVKSPIPIAVKLGRS